MRLRSGRDFSWNDIPDKEPVIIVNEAGARREWPGEDPIGKLADGTGKKPARVIGVDRRRPRKHSRTEVQS